MALTAGRTTRWVFNFAGGTEIVWAENQERANEILLERSVLKAIDRNAMTGGYTPGSTIHSTKGAFVNTTFSPGFDYYVSTTGSSSNTGSITSTWDFATLMNSSVVRPGDTVWVRGGTYNNAGGWICGLVGTEGLPIIIRNYPGERVIITPHITNDQVSSRYVWLWGLEVFNPTPLADLKLGIEFQGNPGVFSSPGNKIINCITHDHSMSGLFMGNSCPGGEVYGTISYNNGRADNSDHGMYLSSSGVSLLVAENIVFNNWAFGIHVFANLISDIDQTSFVGNVSFNNNTISTTTSQGEFLWGSLSTGGATVSLTQNMSYRTSGRDSNAAYTLFSNTPQNGANLTFTDNCGIDGGSATLRSDYSWTKALISRNRLFHRANLFGKIIDITGSVAGYTIDSSNEYYTPAAETDWRYNGSSFTFAAWKTATGFDNPGSNPANSPTTNWVFVRPNAYEPKRANIIIYNWQGLTNVSVDLSKVLGIGDAYTIKNAQDFFGAVVKSGIYDGALVSIPMAGIVPATPIARGTVGPTTGPEFQVFIVRRTSNWES